MNLILDVDTQVDFMLNGGALYVPGAEGITNNIAKLMSKLYLPIISTVDEHVDDDEEFKVFPKHCVKGTTGSWKIEETLVYRLPYFVKRADNLLTDADLESCKQFIVPKKTYNVWDTTLGNPLNMRKLIEFFRPDTVHVLGVATDICVLAAVKGLSEYVNHIVLHQDCTKGLTEENEKKAIEEMVQLGNVWLE